MTKYQIALEIEKVAKILKEDPFSSSRLMSALFDCYTKAELIDRLSLLKSQLN